MGIAFALGLQRADERSQEREQLEAQQRQTQYANLSHAGLSPQKVQQGIGLLYQKDLSAARQHIQNFVSRLTGGKVPPTALPSYAAPSNTSQATPMQVGDQALPAVPPVTVTGPAPRTRQEALADILAQGTTPAQRSAQLEQAKANDALRLAQAKQLAPKQELRLYKGPNGEVACLNAADASGIPQGYQPIVPGGRCCQATGKAA